MQRQDSDPLNNMNSQIVTLKFKKLHEDAIIPKFATQQAAGFDFHALQSYVLKPNTHALIRTGLAMQIEQGFEIQVRSRSGLALKHKVAVLNSPGTIDSDYRGEIQIILSNFGESDFIINQGDRIAQGIVNALPKVNIIETNGVDTTERGINGFGSTGV
ncbi:dUTP diphosphatase [Helicobacter trogontum]|uniref:dUTP diphosphatase n=2 Tax=Helicobacter trogontum TaxID=50960 RepID=A0ABQ0D3Z5_9HELI|nr:dUTP diphosphatase [Helicobacter trogontum]MCI5786100.1 dUTP diphosphatase [Helicobacter trogontum]MDY5185163.1 dUTP diphosphatase [Helicobacter trogontum]